MKLGILQCDKVREQFAIHGQYPERFASLLHPVCPSITFTTFDVEHCEFPQDINEVDAYLITGSRHSVNDNFDWIAALEEFVRTLHQAQKKLIGICFGHQIIAKALGGKVIKWPQGWGVGMSQNKVNQHKEWMQPRQSEFNLLVSHQDQVTELPKEAELLASNDFCPNYMMQIGSHILTVQGHPEFTKAYSQALMELRQTALGEQVFLKGVNSLVLPEDDTLMAQWLIKFLQEKQTL